MALNNSSNDHSLLRDTVVYAFMPELKTLAAHLYQYHIDFRQALQSLDCAQVGWVPISFSGQLHEEWKKILPDEKTGKRSWVERISLWGVYSQAICSMKEGSILFLEHFRLPHLFLFWLSALRQKKNMRLWLLMRYPPSHMKLRGKLLLWMERMYEWLLGRENVFLFTDTQKLQALHEKLFQRTVTVLPIPHAQMKQRSVFKNRTEILCWWPGGRLVEARGLSYIQRFSKKLQSQQSNVRLVVTKEALERGIVPSERVILTENELDRDAYETWMHQVDFALLFYDPQIYSVSSSGVFVEAVCARVLPLTRAGTWMADELMRYDLQELVMDPDREDLIGAIGTLFSDKSIRQRFDCMQKEYCRFHTVEQLACLLQERHKKS